MKKSNAPLQVRPGDVAENHDRPLSTGSMFAETNSPQGFTRQNLQKLIENETYLKQVADNIEQVFWLSDLNSDQILYVSPAFESVWGRSRASLYADPAILLESVHPEDRVQVMVAQPHDDHKPFNQAYRILRPDGSLRWILAHTFTVHDKTGELCYLFCISQDITNEKKIEIAQHKTLDRIREQFNLSHKMSLARKPESVLKTLMAAHELRAAQRAALLFFDAPKVAPVHGVDLSATWIASQTISSWQNEPNLYEDPSFLELFHPMRTMVINSITTDPRLTPVARDLLLEGHIHTMVIFPLIALGEPLGSLVVYYDREIRFNHIELQHLNVLIDQAAITLFNLKLLEAEEESRHEAERANEIKTEFLAMISHELRTPLTSIIGFTTTLLAKDVTWEPEEQQDFIQTIQQEADRLQELIDHLLDLSRLEAGKLPISLKPHLLHEIIEDALPQLNSLSHDKILTINLPGDLPVYVDARRIAQVLVNLVRNASTYAPRDTEVTISSNLRGRFLQINVTDQGPGIPFADHKKVFKAFQRGQNEENGPSKGAGLGLAICKGLVEAHGGHIWIKKRITDGTTVSFTIPLDPPQSSDMTTHEEF